MPRQLMGIDSPEGLAGHKATANPAVPLTFERLAAPGGRRR
jgi:hypothetical protein